MTQIVPVHIKDLLKIRRLDEVMSILSNVMSQQMFEGHVTTSKTVCVLQSF